MTKPYSLETILSEFDEKTVAWVLQEKTTGHYATIPHPKYPGKNPMHFFLSESDAKSVLVGLLEKNEKLRAKEIYPVRVLRIQALDGIASDAYNPKNVDGFVVRSQNEVYEYVRDRAI
jgi:hypothetical protein